MLTKNFQNKSAFLNDNQLKLGHFDISKKWWAKGERRPARRITVYVERSALVLEQNPSPSRLVSRKILGRAAEQGTYYYIPFPQNIPFIVSRQICFHINWYINKLKLNCGCRHDRLFWDFLKTVLRGFPGYSYFYYKNFYFKFIFTSKFI